MSKKILNIIKNKLKNKKLIIQIIIFFSIIILTGVIFNTTGKFIVMLNNFKVHPFYGLLNIVLNFVLISTYILICIIVKKVMFKNKKPKKQEFNKELFSSNGIIKFVIMFCLVIPLSILLFLLSMIITLLIILSIHIIDLIGMIIIFIGVLIAIVYLTALFRKLIKGKFKFNSTPLIVSLIFIIIGSISLLYSITKFSYVNKAPYTFKKNSNVYQYQLEKPVKITNSINIKTDDSLLDNQIKVIVSYNKGIKKIKEKKVNYVDENLQEITYEKEIENDSSILILLILQTLKDLENREIHNYKELSNFNVEVYTNSNTKSLIKQ